jgi:uncharacterized protein (TIGR02391 family)
MRAEELRKQVEEFQRELNEHGKLWGKSLDRTIPTYPILNQEELAEQSSTLSRKLGLLRPFLERFQKSWIMQHPGNGLSWNALDAATALQAVAQMKGPSLRTVSSMLDQIIGELQALGPDDEIPRQKTQSIHAGGTVEKVALGYLDHLHPFIRQGCTQLLIDGHHAQAIEEAAKAVFQYVRDKSGLTLDGAGLAEAAFSLKTCILAFGDLSHENIKNEQLGFMEILKGLAKGVRNPFAHTHGRKEEFQTAFEYLVFTSLLCRRIDEASPSPLDSSPPNL